ncbi:MAG: hypothetical protein ACRD44_17620 [Bryobacteraceae bacterium]
MRQRVDTGYRKAEVRVELVGDPERVGLDRELEQLRIAFERPRGFDDSELAEVALRQLDSPELVGPASNEADSPHRGATGANGLNEHRLIEERSDQELPFLRDG